MAKSGLVLQSQHKFEINTKPDATTGQGVYSRVGAGLNNFDPQNNENVLQDTYLTDEGYSTSTVAGAQLIITFSGHRKFGDAAQDFIFSKQLDLGEARETDFRWTLPDGAMFEGPCTIANISGPSGDANAKGEISFEIHFNGKPKYTPKPAA
ncbi:phage tail tube protein [Bacillus thuringiensis]|uniref:phage tail tube protein n=1 Tax=Bacillus thuringiensis TaxID=1428 RepID=UPI000BFEA11C|nr:capsid protein [Bacillus thuringiensis]MED4447446.1 capsid protein [Bacillus cereus]PGU35140.1 capsid protein [Bacillus thuringiensis]